MTLFRALSCHTAKGFAPFDGVNVNACRFAFRLGLEFRFKRKSLSQRYQSYRPASQSRIPVEHRQVRIRDSEEGTPARGWAYFTYPARLTPLDTPRKVYTNPLAKSCISCEKGWIYRKNRYNDPEAGLCSGKYTLRNPLITQERTCEQKASKRPGTVKRPHSLPLSSRYCDAVANSHVSR